jgi:serine phosphatase RsbU (regulator of sigma subunit)
MARSGPGLDRLLGRASLEALLGSLDAAAPGSQARIVDRGGRVTGQAEAHHAARGPVREYPITVGGEGLGTLVVAAGAAGAPAELTVRALEMAAEQALNVRFLAAETLERYRELNVLYEVGERIAGSLDPDEIAAVALAECRRVAAAGAAAVLLDLADAGQRIVTAGDEPVVGLLAAAEGLVARVRDTGSADIVAEPAGVDGSTFGSLLAVPLRTGRQASGVLVLGRGAGRPPFSASDEKVVSAVAAQLAIALQSAALHEREVERRRMEDELAVGRRIQLGLLPLDAPQPPGWEISASYRAARQVGGDFYDFVVGADGPGTIGLIVGDVAGKGVPAALMMAYSRAVMRSEALGGRAPAEVLAHANETMLGECQRAALLVTAFLGSLDSGTGRLRYASAGHDWPLLVTADGTATFLPSSGVMLGMVERGEFEEREIGLSPGDVLAIYTDGITEARSPEGALFGEERLVEALQSAHGRSASDAIDVITAAVDAFAAGAPPADDLTLVVVRRQPS